jgi:DNA-binding PadR family transcriptional regulator
MMKQTYLGEFEMIVLAALLRLGDRAYGVVVRREIEERGGRVVSIGAVYTTLNRLEQKGYVSSRVGEPTSTRGGRAKRFFKIEAAGAHALDASIRALSCMVDGLEFEGNPA